MRERGGREKESSKSLKDDLAHLMLSGRRYSGGNTLLRHAPNDESATLNSQLRERDR